MAVVSVIVGATTPNSAVVVGQVESVSSVRLAVAGDEAITNPDFTGAEAPSAQGMVRFQVTGLLPDNRYFFQLETDSALDGPVGRFRTHPPLGVGNSDVLIAAAGDAGRTPESPPVTGTLIPERMSNNPIHTLIVDNRDPLMFIHLGDEGYYNIGSGEKWEDENGDPIVLNDDLDTYRRQYEDVFLQPHQHYMARRVSRVHVWDDHEFGGGPDVGSDRTLPGRDNATLAYREREAHYPLPAGTGANPVYHSWQIDRTLFVALDSRSDRDPNDDPAGPSKTMLGTSQRTWLDNLLTNSTAQALVLISSSNWLGVGADSWNSYQDERNQLVQLFEDTGFLDRMVILNANTHFLAIEDGSNNDFGGMPVYVFAPLDSTPTTSSVHTYSHGFQSAQFGQYGTLRVRDTGGRIEITGTGWNQDTIWNLHTLTITVSGEEPEPDPEPEPAPPTFATPEVRTRVTWLGCRLVDGRVISEIPDITGQVSRVLGDVTTSGLTLPIPISGPGALPIGLVEQITEPGRAMIAAIVNDIPTWAGIVGVSEGGTEATMSVPVSSLESYLGRRIVRTHEFDQIDEALIAAALVGDAGPISGVGPGIGLEVDAPPTGTLRTREYLLTDRKTVLEALQELMGVIEGPEWTIDLDWTDDTHTAIAKIFRVRKRIGVASTSPNAVFMARANAVFGSRFGSEARYRYKIDYTEGHGANYVVAYSSGQEEDQPASAPAIAQEVLDAGYPVYEQHFQPSSNITSQPVLDAHAAAELDRRRRGTRTFTIEARWDAYPRYGVDWELGDDIAWDLVGHRHPQGILGRGRAVGFTLDMQTQTIRPILEEDQ